MEDVVKEQPREKALRELRTISWWQNNRKDGEWVPESVATGVERKYECHAKDKDGNIVKRTTKELVHVHGGYRPKFSGEKKTRKAFFFRGARVWRD